MTTARLQLFAHDAVAQATAEGADPGDIILLGALLVAYGHATTRGAPSDAELFAVVNTSVKRLLVAFRAAQLDIDRATEVGPMYREGRS